MEHKSQFQFHPQILPTLVHFLFLQNFTFQKFISFSKTFSFLLEISQTKIIFSFFFLLKKSIRIYGYLKTFSNLFFSAKSHFHEKIRGKHIASLKVYFSHCNSSRKFVILEFVIGKKVKKKEEKWRERKIYDNQLGINGIVELIKHSETRLQKPKRLFPIAAHVFQQSKKKKRTKTFHSPFVYCLLFCR